METLVCPVHQENVAAVDTTQSDHVQPKKLEIMHFTRGPDRENPPFHLPSLNQPIIAPKSLCWLGFHLDHHLHFTHHTKILAAKVTRTVHAMHILGNLVKGMSHPQLRTLTLMTILLKPKYCLGTRPRWRALYMSEYIEWSDWFFCVRPDLIWSISG